MNDPETLEPITPGEILSVHAIIDRLKKVDDHWRYDDSQGLAVQGSLFDPPLRSAAIE